MGRPPKLLGLGRGVSGLLDPLGRGRRFVPRSSIWGRRTGPNGATATNCSRGRRGALARRVVLEVLEAGTTTRAATVLLGQAVGRAQLDGEGERGGGES